MIEKLISLREKVKKRLSDKRFMHTEGVADAANLLGKLILPDMLDELLAAAYLHDIAKELDIETQILLCRQYGYEPTASDLKTPLVIHSFAAPALIKRDFPDFDTENIISAVFNHTVGNSDMTIFDEIIFVSDYIESGRKYPSCISVRRELINSLDNSKSKEEYEYALHCAALSSIEYTISNLNEKKQAINPKMLIAEKYFKEILK